MSTKKVPLWLQVNRIPTNSQVSKYLTDLALIDWIVDRWEVEDSWREIIKKMLKYLEKELSECSYEQDCIVTFEGSRIFAIGMDCSTFRLWISNPFWLKNGGISQPVFDWQKTAYHINVS